jgi:hypothetical protein
MISTFTLRWRSLLSTNQRASSPNSSAWPVASDSSLPLFDADGLRTPARTMGTICCDASGRRSRARRRSAAGVASTIAD